MNLYLLNQYENNGWDTHDSMVVIAESEEDAKTIHPSGNFQWDSHSERWFYVDCFGDKKYSDCASWTDNLAAIQVTFLGKAKEGSVKGCILASFNAG